MSDEKKSELERMSLDSLKRELEVQKAQTAQAREAAKERIEEESRKAKAFPWPMLLGVLGAGVVLFFVLVFALRSSFPGVAEAALPDWVYTPPPDAGPRPDAGHAVAAGPPDAGHASTGHTGHHTPTGHHSSSSSGGLDLSGLGGGEDETDPVGGLTP